MLCGHKWRHDRWLQQLELLELLQPMVLVCFQLLLQMLLVQLALLFCWWWHRRHVGHRIQGCHGGIGWGFQSFQAWGHPVQCRLEEGRCHVHRGMVPRVPVRRQHWECLQEGRAGKDWARADSGHRRAGSCISSVCGIQAPTVQET